MRKKILIVDDDPDFQEGIKVILEKADYACVQAYSMHQGLRLVSEVNPDLIILDIMMEDISAGFRFVKARLEVEDRNAEAHTPILFISGIRNVTGFDFGNRLKEFLLSRDGFLDKPVDPKVLIDRIGMMVGQMENEQYNKMIHLRNL